MFVCLKVYKGEFLVAEFTVNIVMMLCTVPYKPFFSFLHFFVYLNNKCIFKKLMEINVFELLTFYL